MKTLLLPVLTLFFVTSTGLRAESTVEKVGDKTKDAVKATESAVKKAAKKTGDAVKDVADKTGEMVKETADKTGDAVKKAAGKTEKEAKKVGDDVTNSEIYKKVEAELGKPFSAEQKEKYAAAWKEAQEKARAAEADFAAKISEITGVGKKKTKKIVKDSGL